MKYLYSILAMLMASVAIASYDEEQEAYAEAEAQQAESRVFDFQDPEAYLDIYTIQKHYKTANSVNIMIDVLPDVIFDENPYCYFVRAKFRKAGETEVEHDTGYMWLHPEDGAVAKWENLGTLKDPAWYDVELTFVVYNVDLSQWEGTLLQKPKMFAVVDVHMSSLEVLTDYGVMSDGNDEWVYATGEEDLVVSHGFGEPFTIETRVTVEPEDVTFEVYEQDGDSDIGNMQSIEHLSFGAPYVHNIDVTAPASTVSPNGIKAVMQRMLDFRLVTDDAVNFQLDTVTSTVFFTADAPQGHTPDWYKLYIACNMCQDTKTILPALQAVMMQVAFNGQNHINGESAAFEDLLWAAIGGHIAVDCITQARAWYYVLNMVGFDFYSDEGPKHIMAGAGHTAVVYGDTNPVPASGTPYTAMWYDIGNMNNYQGVLRVEGKYYYINGYDTGEDVLDVFCERSFAHPNPMTGTSDEYKRSLGFIYDWPVAPEAGHWFNQ